MQTYEERLAQLRDKLGCGFGVRKKKKLVFGHHEGEFKETDSAVERLLKETGGAIQTLVELGVNWGASLFMLSRFAQIPAKIVGVDAGLFPGIDDVHVILDALREEGHAVTFLHDTTQRSVAAVEQFAPIDLLHIDADHSYAGAKHDWDHYTPMVRQGGTILLHDITYMKGVGQFWQQCRKPLERFYEIKIGDRGMAVIVKTW